MNATSFLNPSIQRNYLFLFFQAEEGGSGKSATALYDYQASKFPLIFSLSITYLLFLVRFVSSVRWSAGNCLHRLNWPIIPVCQINIVVRFLWEARMAQRERSPTGPYAGRAVVGFSLGSSVFLPAQKPKYQNSN